jgi:hypothetical protein
MGFPAESIPDVMSAVPASGWSVNDQGAPELRDKTGAVLYDVTSESWMAEQAKGRWSYVMNRVAGQNSGGSVGALDGKPNLWGKDTWNDAEQAKVFRESAAKAAQLAAAAGSRVGALPPDQRLKTTY